MDILKEISSIGSKIIDLVFHSPKFSFVLCLVTEGILFLPPNILAPLRLVEVRESHGWVFGIVFLLTLFLSIAHLAPNIWEAVGVPIMYRWRERNRKKTIKNQLHNLNSYQKDALAPYIRNRVDIQYLSAISADISELTETGVLKFLEFYISGTDKTPHTIDLWAYQYLQEHPELLE